MTPEHLDRLFPGRRDIGGCAPELAAGFIPAAMLVNLTDEQVEALTPRWRSIVQRIAIRADSADCPATEDEALQPAS